MTHCCVQYIPRNMHTVFALLCFVVVILWLIFPYPSGLLHWHCVNLTIAPVPAKQPWWIWVNTSCEFIMNDCITTTKQSTTKPCAYFLGYTVWYWAISQLSKKNLIIHKTGVVYEYKSMVKGKIRIKRDMSYKRMALYLKLLWRHPNIFCTLYNDAIMGAITYQITSLTIVFSAVYSRANQRKHQRSASLALMLGIHRWLVNSPHKWPVTRKMFTFDNVVMDCKNGVTMIFLCLGEFEKISSHLSWHKDM